MGWDGKIKRASAAHRDAECDMALLFTAVAGELDREDGDGGRGATACFLANRERACAAEVRLLRGFGPAFAVSQRSFVVRSINAIAAAPANTTCDQNGCMIRCQL
jgi:hypothetical protein